MPIFRTIYEGQSCDDTEVLADVFHFVASPSPVSIFSALSATRQMTSSATSACPSSTSGSGTTAACSV